MFCPLHSLPLHCHILFIQLLAVCANTNTACTSPPPRTEWVTMNLFRGRSKKISKIFSNINVAQMPMSHGIAGNFTMMQICYGIEGKCIWRGSCDEVILIPLYTINSAFQAIFNCIQGCAVSTGSKPQSFSSTGSLKRSANIKGEKLLKAHYVYQQWLYLWSKLMKNLVKAFRKLCC